MTSEAETSQERIFICYSHHDKKWLNMLRDYLDNLERDYNVSVWDDSKIDPGTNWQKEINTAIEQSRIAICFLSENFMNSEFILSKELPFILESAEKKGTIVIPIIVTPFHLKAGTEYLSQIQSANPKPLNEMTKVEQKKIFKSLSEYVSNTFRDVSRTKMVIKRFQPDHTTSSRYNIVAVGKAGVGKSSLINYLFGREIREVGIGRPVTRRGFHKVNFDIVGIPVTLFDSWGLEAGREGIWMEVLDSELESRSTRRSVENWFHTVLYCIAASSTRIEDFEIKILDHFKYYNYRVIVVFTKADLVSNADLAEFELKLREFIDEKTNCVAVCSVTQELRFGKTERFGEGELKSQIYRNFWDSIRLRLPERCINLALQFVDQWYDSQKYYVENNVGYFNASRTYTYLDRACRIFTNSLQRDNVISNMIIKEIKNTIRIYGKFVELLNIDESEINVDVSFENIRLKAYAADQRWILALPSPIILVPFLPFLGTILGIAGAALAAMSVAGLKGENQAEFISMLDNFVQGIKDEIKKIEPSIERILENLLSEARTGVAADPELAHKGAPFH